MGGEAGEGGKEENQESRSLEGSGPTLTSRLSRTRRGPRDSDRERTKRRGKTRNGGVGGGQREKENISEPGMKEIM